MPRTYVDTNVIISIVEAATPLAPAQMQFLKSVDTGKTEAITSELTLAECLVKPLAERNAAAVAAYLAFLDGRPNFPVIPISRGILLSAARLRGERGLKLPDAIHLATATACGCTVFLSDDRRIKSLDELQIQAWATLPNP